MPFVIKGWFENLLFPRVNMNFIELKSGTSVEGSEIKAYKTDVKASSYIYIIAGVHGDEVEGVYVGNQLFEWLKEEENLELPLVVVPIQNVDGYRAGTAILIQSHGYQMLVLQNISLGNRH
jgi:predicted deacylase